ncbi:MAG: alpha-amylase family glycosyl hydrolase [Myxococcota bacterium]
MNDPWWKSAVFYQIYPRSFCDTTGNGVGDLRGILAHLDHLAWLGVDGLWLSPFYRSPMRDFGYDVSDHRDVDPLFGTLDDFDALLEAAHVRGLRVLIDWVPAHTSSEHPWFIESCRSRTGRRRDWYVWRDSGPDGSPPNNWTSAFTGGSPAWTRDERTGQLYLHSFLPEQPDLNWRNPDVVAAMHETLRFWLRRGVDGFRADVVHNILKDPELRDVASELAPLPHVVLNDEPGTHALLRDIRRVLDEFDGNRLMVGEVFLLRTEQIVRYYGRGDELQLCFCFPPLFAPWEADAWHEALAETFGSFDPADAWPTWVLSNHDQPRHRTRYGGSERRARAAAVLLLSLRGTPFLYMGEELGLEDAHVPRERAVDPGGRDGCRAPLPWDASPNHGWAAEPWLPWPPECDRRDVATQRRAPDSILALYRRLIAARRHSPALHGGKLDLLPGPIDVLIYRRHAALDERLIAINFGDGLVRLGTEIGGWVEVSSEGRGEGERFSGSLEPGEAVVLVTHPERDRGVLGELRG